VTLSFQNNPFDRYHSFFRRFVGLVWDSDRVLKWTNECRRGFHVRIWRSRLHFKYVWNEWRFATYLRGVPVTSPWGFRWEAIRSVVWFLKRCDTTDCAHMSAISITYRHFHICTKIGMQHLNLCSSTWQACWLERPAIADVILWFTIHNGLVITLEKNIMAG